MKSLRDSLNHIKEKSIRWQIRLLVREALEKDDYLDAEEKGILARDLYDMRSKLVHDGKTDKPIPMTDVEDIVRRTLLSIMRHGLLEDEPR